MSGDTKARHVNVVCLICADTGGVVYWKAKDGYEAGDVAPCPRGCSKPRSLDQMTAAVQERHAIEASYRQADRDLEDLRAQCGNWEAKRRLRLDLTFMLLAFGLGVATRWCT